MKKRVLVRGPVLTRSGYGEHARLVLRSLKNYQNKYDLYVDPINWGNTSWLYEDNEERKWIDELATKSLKYRDQQGGNPQYDMSVQVTIPNEWEKLAPVNVGVTAGIETTQISPEWVEKSFIMDKILVPSQHAKVVYENTTYQAEDQNGNIINDFSCKTPIEVVPYPAKVFKSNKQLKLNLDYDFNFLTVAQWGPRKNLGNTIKWFVEEFFDREVGLVVKTSRAKNNIYDRGKCQYKIEKILKNYPKDRKCKVYLLHGTMSEEEMSMLFKHKKIKAYVTATHGEGYGLPIFDAVCNGMPVIAPDWSGHVDFLYMPVSKKEKNKSTVKIKAQYAKVNYTLQQIPDSAVWNGVLQKESKWCYPDQGSFKMKLREVYKDHGRFKKQAKELQKFVLENYENEKILKRMAAGIVGKENLELQKTEYVFVSDFFVDEYVGGAELSLKTLYDLCPSTLTRLKTSDLDAETIEFFKDSKWVFGNMTHMSTEMLNNIANSEINYSFVEFDYKFCKHRNPALYKFIEGEEPNYNETVLGKVVENFVNNAQSVFFMSEKQKELYASSLSGLKNDNTYVLSSIFDDEFFDVIDQLKDKDYARMPNSWLVLGSNSYIKGTAQSEKWCQDNNKDYRVIQNMPYIEVLQSFASSEGVCFLPTGEDTCPRFVIEAKLLGCQLQLNDYVQHKDEEWFNLPNDELEAYLRTRKDFFWMKAFDNE